MTSGTIESWLLNPAPIRAAVEVRDTWHLEFQHLHRATRYASPEERQSAFELMPMIDQELTWRRLAQARSDYRYSAGLVEFESQAARHKRTASKPRRARKNRPDLAIALDRLREIPAEDYLEPIAEVEPLRGRVHCPLPDHEDRHPSASYRGSLWHCHACGEGGDLIGLASKVSGISTSGKEFRRLLAWIADRLPTDFERERLELQEK